MKYLILLLCLLSASVKVYLSNQQPLLNDWDERFHGVVAANIADDRTWWKPTLYHVPVLKREADEWAGSHVWMHKQPLPFWTMALSIRALGKSALAVRLPSILFVSIAVYLTFLIGRHLFDEVVGLFAATLFAIHGLSNELSIGVEATDHIDIHFMFWVLAAAYLMIVRPIRHRYANGLLIGLAVGLAVLVKWLPAYTMLLAYFVYEARTIRFKQLLTEASLIVSASLIVWLPWQIYAYLHYPEAYLATQAHNYRHVTQYLEGHVHGYFYFLDKSIFNYGDVWVPAVLLFLYKSVKQGLREHQVLLIWIIVPFLFFTFVATKMQAYVYFTAPAIFVASGVVLAGLYDRQPWKGISVGKLAVLLLFVSPSVHLYESLHPREHDAKLVVRLHTYEPLDLSRTVIFNSPTPFNDMFFLDVVASYDYVPSKGTLDSLRGVYTVVVEE